jgi:hypothetical protein
MPRSAFEGALENQLQSELEQPRIANLQWLPKRWTCGAAIHAKELGMVKYVEEFRPELQTQLLSYPSLLENAHVPIVDRRIAAKSTRRGAELARRYVVIELTRSENETV